MKTAKLKVLLVEDNHEHAAIVAFAFRKSGMEVTVARNGRDAIAFFGDQTFIPDILILDYILPDTDGIELMQRLRIKGVTAPLIMMTAYEDRDTAVKAYRAGVDDFLFKIENYHDVLPGLVLKVVKNHQLGITKNKLEQTINEQHSQLETLFREAPNPILFIDEKQRFIDANPAALRFLAITKKELKAGAIEALIYKEDLGCIAKMLINPANGSNSEISFYIGNRVKTVLFSQVPVTINGQKVACFIGYDISSEREAALAMQRQLEVMAVLTKLSQSLLDASLSQEKVTGMVIESAVQVTGSEMGWLLSDYDQRGLPHLLAVVHGNETSIIPERNTNASNQPPDSDDNWKNHVLLPAEPLVVNQEETVPAYLSHHTAVVKVKRYATVPVLSEDKVMVQITVADSRSDYDQQHIGYLQQAATMFLLAAKRKQIEKELIVAKERAEESDNLKTAFLSNVSHEIRTPLNAVVGFSQLLREPALSSEERDEYIDAISVNTESLLRLIDDIIELARIEAGEILIMNEPFELKPLMDRIYRNAEVIRRDLKKEHLTLLMSLNADENLAISGDKIRIRQVLLNLIKNALKFTIKGRVEFGYNLIGSGENEQPDSVCFFVSDTGIGIEEDKLKIIFDRFRQLEDTYTRVHGGTGLGLTISRNLVSLLGGKIWVESKVGQGTVFRFTIPFTKTTIAEIKETGTHHIPTIDWRQKTILIVEDVDSNYRYLKACLKHSGANILWAVTGSKAIEAVSSIPELDLVLMDLQMPEMNGYDATRIIKNIRKELPVIAQTSYAMSGDREKSLEAGCDDYIAKPIRSGDLIAIIAKYI